ncbi:MAG: CbiX/SirB N-terminal domain-containing protein [Pseudomonadota bacterium]
MFGPLDPTLLMVAHGTSVAGGDPARRLADRVRSSWDGPVHFGYMRSTPGLAPVLRRLCETGLAHRLVVIPLFFSTGYLVQTELPQRLHEAGLEDACVLPPVIGLEGFKVMMVGQIRAVLHQQGWRAGDSTVFLVPHGLKILTEPLPETVVLAKALGSMIPGIDVQIACIEGQPSLTHWRTMSRRKQAVFLPMLAGGGVHARDDVPEMISAHDDEAVQVMKPVGTWAELPGLIVSAGVR